MTKLDTPTHVYYRLNPKGATIAAARKIRDCLIDTIKANFKGYHGRDYITQVAPELARINRDLLPVLLEEMPDELAGLGYTKPATIVRAIPGTHPRAYQTYPSLRLGFDRKLYLVMPVDYNGVHHTPLDATQIDGEKADEVLYQRNGDSYDASPLLWELNDVGVAIPADFNPATQSDHDNHAPNYGLMKNRPMLIAHGETLKLITDYEASIDGSIEGAFHPLSMIPELCVSGRVPYMRRFDNNGDSITVLVYPQVRPGVTISLPDTTQLSLKSYLSLEADLLDERRNIGLPPMNKDVLAEITRRPERPGAADPAATRMQHG